MPMYKANVVKQTRWILQESMLSIIAKHICAGVVQHFIALVYPKSS